LKDNVSYYGGVSVKSSIEICPNCEKYW